MKGILRTTTVIIISIILLCGGVYAYTALTSTGTVTVKEPLSFVGSSTFTIDIWPQQTLSAQITVANASPTDLSVSLSSVIVPDPGQKGLTVTIPNSVSVPGNGQVPIDIQVVASKSASPGAYTITMTIDR